MKLGGGFLIWSIIAFLFFRWVSSNAASLRPTDIIVESTPTDEEATEPLTFEAVQTAFEQAGEPAIEPGSR